MVALRRAALYLGAFLGPFGGGLTAAMLPELGAGFGVPTATASVSITAYLLPFAGVMLVSGTLGDRWGRGRTVVAGYALYVVASLACVLAVSWPVFLAGRALQGVANAFTTPVLLAALAAAVEPDRLGRALGWFGSLQAAGQTSAPLFGGLAAEVLDCKLGAESTFDQDAPAVPGQEHHIYMLSGQMSVAVDDVVHRLDQGDSLRFRPHGRVRLATGLAAAKYILVTVTP